jgi:hypothetical protein
MKKVIHTLNALNLHDAALFFAFFLVPTFGVILFKLAGLPQIVVTTLPVVAMLLYAAMMIFARRLRLRNDQAGDNLYYLGFLFTLVSLSASLVEFTVSGGAQYIIKNFGIALATTILGVMLRVGFSQMRRDPIEVERQARLELAEASRRLRVELDNCLLEFNNYRRATHQSVADGLVELQTMAEKVLTAATGQVETAATSVATRIETAFSGFAEKSEAFNASAEKLVASLEYLSHRIDAVSAPADLVTTRIEPATSAISRVVEAFEARARADAERSQEMARTAEATSSAAAAAFERIEAAARTMETVPPRAESLAAALSTMETSLATSIERMDAATSQLADNLGATEVRARLNELTHTLSDMVGAVRQAGGTWGTVQGETAPAGNA